MKEAKDAIEGQLEVLFAWLKYVDEQLESSDTRGLIKFLVKRLEDVELRMEGDKKHARPHVHIKYKKKSHIASFAIDDGSRIVGDDLPAHYDPIIEIWIKKNRRDLRKLWNSVQKGQKDEKILLKFQKEVYD